MMYTTSDVLVTISALLTVWVSMCLLRSRFTLLFSLLNLMAAYHVYTLCFRNLCQCESMPVLTICTVMQANSEVSALLGRIPSAVGYQPTLATDLGCLQERITTTKAGSITSVQAVYVPADDLTDPAPATTFAHLDATTVLSRAIAELGIYPAVDPLDSTSRMLDKRIIGEAHYNCARQVQKVLQDYKNLQVCCLLNIIRFSSLSHSVLPLCVCHCS